MRSIVLKILVPLGLILAGVGLILAGPRSLAVQVDEQPAVTFYVFGISVADGLRSAGIPFTTADRVYPGLNKLLMNTAVVSLQHARPVSILGRGEAFLASGELPANWLMFAGVRLFRGIGFSGTAYRLIQPVQSRQQPCMPCNTSLLNWWIYYPRVPPFT